MVAKKYGLAFPLAINSDGVNEHPTLKESLDGSLSTILSWHLNTRAFVNNFGSILYLQLGKPHTEALRGSIVLYVYKAIGLWEPRLINVKVQTQFGTDWIKLTVTGEIRESQEIYNYSTIL